MLKIDFLENFLKKKKGVIIKMEYETDCWLMYRLCS